MGVYQNIRNNTYKKPQGVYARIHANDDKFDTRTSASISAASAPTSAVNKSEKPIFDTTKVQNRIAELDNLMKDTDLKIRQHAKYTPEQRSEFQKQYGTYKDEYWKLKNELDAQKKVVLPTPTTSAPQTYLSAGKENKTLGDKATNFIHSTLPNTIEDRIDKIKEPFVGTSLSDLMTEAKLSPQLLKEDVELQLSKEDPTRADYSMIKQTKKAVEKYGLPTSNIKAMSGDNAQLLKDLERAEKTYQASPVDATIANIGAAGAGILGDFAGFTNMLGADKVPVVKDINNAIISTAEVLQENAQDYNVGTYGGYMGNLTQIITRMVPYFIVGTGKAVTTGGKVAQAVASTIKNPSFWVSLTTIAGQKYNENMNNGVGRGKATLNALLTAIPSALVEVGGGIGAQGKEAQNLLRTIVEENFEEISQGIIEGASDRLTTKPDMPIYSTTEEAIINPKQMSEEVLYTTPATLLTGGVSKLNQNIQTQRANREMQKINARYQEIQKEKNASNAKNNVPNAPQVQNMQQPNVTLPTRAEIAQKANMEQIRGNTKLITQKADNKPTNSFQRGLEKFNSKNYTQKDNIVVLEETPLYLYNLGYDTDKPIVLNMSKLETIMKEPKGTFDGKNQHGITMDVVKQLPQAIQNPLNVIRNPKYRDRFVVITELADQYGDIVIVPIEMNTNGYIENIETDVNRIASVYGKENYDIPKREGLESYSENNKNNIVYDIDNDPTIKRNTTNDYRLQLPSTVSDVPNNIIPNNDTNINTEYAQNISNDTADTQSAFSMPENYISPLNDLEGATNFVKNATEKDVDALQKMVDEANKHPDRIDLQFFAEEARKKIEYLTKSQRYQRSKIATLTDNLVKTYGLDKNGTKKAISEYVQEYNSDADVTSIKSKLLKELSSNGVLNGQPMTEISNMLDEFNNDLDTVKRYEADRAQKKQENVDYQLNYETVSKLYELKKQYQKAADKVMQNTLLTKADSIQLDRLLKGEITFDELPKNVNRKELEKAYEARKPLADVNKEIQNYNKVVKQRRNEKMRELTSNSVTWKDKKSGLAYARETQERNIADIAPQEEAKRITKELFEPVHRNEAQATRYKNEVRDKINGLKIGLKPKYEVTYTDAQGPKTEKVSESGLIQLYGEVKINDDVLNKLGVDVEKIKSAVATFREIYNDLYHKTNEVLVKNGYAPVEFRKDYFPHFEETKPDTLIGKVLTKLGFKMDTRELPTDIAGLTHTFRPGKKWVSNFLQRTNDVATYDAIKGFDNYLDGVADVIYHTEDIQNLRAFESALRYQHSEEVIKEQIDEIMDLDVANEMKQSMIDQVYAAAENSLAHYVTDLRAYTDNLAGKKSLEDRTMEHNLGRGIYNITKNVQSRVSANMVGANISSALTNFIPLTQASAVIDTPHLLQATWDTVRGAVKSDGFAEQSDFLINRRGSDKLYKTAVDKLAGATNLMSLFDNITSEIINRGRYYQNVSNGMSEADARVEADQMSANMMADRSKGSMPTVFNQSSPVTKLLTAFQLEVNNQYSYLFKDIPREFKDKVVGNLIWGFVKMFIGAWLYNELYEKMTGRRAALDPINIVTETIGDVAQGKKASEVALNLGKEVVEDIPFVGGFWGGGRLPISSALPDVGEVAKAGISLLEEGDKKKAWQTLISEIAKPVFYILPPFGGGQLKKSIEGLYTYAKGGNYGINSKGEETLKYPVEQTPANLAKSALFGKWSTKEAVNYVDNGFKSLSVNQTESYKKAMEAGITSEQFYDAYNAQKGIESDKDKDGKTITNSKSLKKKQAIDEATKGLNVNQKKILYDAFDVSKTVQEGKMLPTQAEQNYLH